MNTKNLCCFCRLPKANQKCQSCHEDTCRSCMKLISPEHFKFENNLKAELQHLKYCPNCYSTLVEPELERYEAQVLQAKEMRYWTKAYRGTIPILRKSNTTLKTQSKPDREDVLLQLAYDALSAGFNALLQVEIKSTKVRENNYQKMIWSGSALPVMVDLEKIINFEERF